jgi:hypothetical protein
MNTESGLKYQLDSCLQPHIPTANLYEESTEWEPYNNHSRLQYCERSYGFPNTDSIQLEPCMLMHSQRHIRLLASTESVQNGTCQRMNPLRLHHQHTARVENDYLMDKVRLMSDCKHCERRVVIDANGRDGLKHCRTFRLRLLTSAIGQSWNTKLCRSCLYI